MPCCIICKLASKEQPKTPFNRGQIKLHGGFGALFTSEIYLFDSKKTFQKSFEKQLTNKLPCDMISRLLRNGTAEAVERNIDNCIKQYKV